MTGPNGLRASRVDVKNADEVLLLGLTALFTAAEILRGFDHHATGVTLSDIGRKAFHAADSILDSVAKRRDGTDDGPKVEK
jgi:hypothetical protein